MAVAYPSKGPVAFRNRRDRIVVFRVTDEEYNILLQACDEKNGRNLSDFARTELLNVLAASHVASTPTDTAGLEARIAQIEARLAARSEAAPAPAPAQAISLPEGSK